MRTLFLTISLLFLVSCSHEVDFDDLIKHNCLWYEEGSTTPFTGTVTWTGNSEEGQEWMSDHYGYYQMKNGLHDGLEVWLRGDGSPFLTINWKEGKKNGEIIYHKQYGSDGYDREGGDIDIRGFYIEGSLVRGSVELVFPDGTVEKREDDEIFFDQTPCEPTKS